VRKIYVAECTRTIRYWATRNENERVVARTATEPALLAAARLLSMPDGSVWPDPHSCPVIYGGANL
jgi:putative intracellular protease/amidase